MLFRVIWVYNEVAKLHSAVPHAYPLNFLVRAYIVTIQQFREHSTNLIHLLHVSFSSAQQFDLHFLVAYSSLELQLPHLFWLVFQSSENEALQTATNNIINLQPYNKEIWLGLNGARWLELEQRLPPLKSCKSSNVQNMIMVALHHNLSSFDVY